MKYLNANKVLPADLVNEIKKHVEGVYIYIPKNKGNRKDWGSNTNYHRDMKLRNINIYDRYLEGSTYKDIANRYHLSEKSIRRIILAAKKVTEKNKMMMKDIIKHWNMDGEPEKIYHSTWSITPEYVIKEYESESNLKRNIEMMKLLRNAGIPVPKVIPLPNGQDYLIHNEKMYMINSKLKGINKKDWMNSDSSWFYDFGQIVAKLHLALQSCQKVLSYWNNSMLEEMKGWVTETLKNIEQPYASEEAVQQAIDELEAYYVHLPKQLIHRDVHLGNFLFDGDAFTGYIDFDFSQSNIRIFDLSYFLLGLLTEGNIKKISLEKWLSICREVVNGYDSILPLHSDERLAMVYVMKNIELLCLAYFLKIGNEKLTYDTVEIYEYVLKHEAEIKQTLQ